MTSPRTSRVAMLTEFGRPLEVRELPIPDPEPGALVVRIPVATVCGSDVHQWEGAYAARAQPPLVIGHEMVGEIVAMGDGGEIDSLGAPLRVGDRVVAAPAECGHCFTCTVDRQPSLCGNRRYGMWHPTDQFPFLGGSFAEYTYVDPGSKRLRVPDAVKSEWASAASCALRTVVVGLERIGLVDYRHSVVVQGAGPLGLFAIALLSLHAPAKLIVIGGPEGRLELARTWGADETVSIDDYGGGEERVARVLELTSGGADVVVEVSGAVGALAESVEMARLGGRIAAIGTAHGPQQLVSVPLITTRQLTIAGSFSAGIDAYWRALQFLETHHRRFDWDAMITNRYRLDSVADCLSAMKLGTEIKPVIVPGDG